MHGHVGRRGDAFGAREACGSVASLLARAPHQEASLPPVRHQPVRRGVDARAVEAARAAPVVRLHSRPDLLRAASHAPQPHLLDHCGGSDPPTRSRLACILPGNPTAVQGRGSPRPLAHAPPVKSCGPYCWSLTGSTLPAAPAAESKQPPGQSCSRPMTRVPPEGMDCVWMRGGAREDVRGRPLRPGMCGRQARGSCAAHLAARAVGHPRQPACAAQHNAWRKADMDIGRAGQSMSLRA